MSLFSLLFIVYCFLLHSKPTPIGSKVISTWSPADLRGKVRSRDLDASKQKPRNVPLASADVCEKDDCVTSPKECLLDLSGQHVKVRRCYESGTNSKWRNRVGNAQNPSANSANKDLPWRKSTTGRPGAEMKLHCLVYITNARDVRLCGESRLLITETFWRNLQNQVTRKL